MSRRPCSTISHCSTTTLTLSPHELNCSNASSPCTSTGAIRRGRRGAAPLRQRGLSRHQDHWRTLATRGAVRRLFPFRIPPGWNIEHARPHRDLLAPRRGPRKQPRRRRDTHAARPRPGRGPTRACMSTIQRAAAAEGCVTQAGGRVRRRRGVCPARAQGWAGAGYRRGACRTTPHGRRVSRRNP